MPGEEAERYFLQWDFAMQKQGVLTGWDIIIQKNQKIHCLMYVYTCYVGLEGHAR